MLTAELKSKVDRIWDAFGSGGVSDSLVIVEQIAYLVLLRLLDSPQEAKEREAFCAGSLAESPVYNEEMQDLRWSNFTAMQPQQMLVTIRDRVFPWLNEWYSDQGTPHDQGQAARFAITTPGLLATAVDIVNNLPLETKEMASELYDYILGKAFSKSADFGEFYTPRHIVELMVEMTRPTVEDEICDPACGTAGLLVASARYIERTQEGTPAKQGASKEGVSLRLHGFDSNCTALWLARLNLLIHRIDAPQISHRDSLSIASEEGHYSLILSNPPFSGLMYYEDRENDLQQAIRTNNRELLFLSLSLKLLGAGGRAALVVPDGTLFDTSTAHKQIRRILVEDHMLEAVVKLPSGTFMPYTGVSASILLYTKTGTGGTDRVWFYDASSNGRSLNGKRKSLPPGEDLGSVPRALPSESEGGQSNLTDVLAHWEHRNENEKQYARTNQSFCVSREEISSNDYDLTVNRYRTTSQAIGNPQEKGWRLGDFAQVIAGYVKSSEIDKNPVPAGANQWQRVLHPSCLTVPPPPVDDLPLRVRQVEPRYRLREGDIVGRDLASSRNWTVLPRDYEGVQAGQGLLVIRIVREVVSARYVAAYLSTSQAEKDFPLYGVIPRIRRQGMEDLIIPECEGNINSIDDAIKRLEETVLAVGRVYQALRESGEQIFQGRTSLERRVRLEQADDLGSLIVQSLHVPLPPSTNG